MDGEQRDVGEQQRAGEDERFSHGRKLAMVFPPGKARNVGIPSRTTTGPTRRGDGDCGRTAGSSTGGSEFSERPADGDPGARQADTIPTGVLL